MVREHQDNLTERFTIRFTAEERSQFEELAEKENERKVSSLLRRILVAYLKARIKP